MVVRGTFIAFYGLGASTWSEGMRDISDAVRDQFQWTTRVYRHGQKETALEFLQALSNPGPIVIMGHSMGANSMDWVAENYKKPIAAVFSVAGAFSERLPDNVDRVYAIIASRDWRKFQVTGGQWNQRTVINATHTSVDNSAELKKLVTDELSRLSERENPVNVPAANTSFTNATFDKTRFFDAVREGVFGGSLNQNQVDGMNMLLDCWNEHCKPWDYRELAYDLGTAFHETARTMNPIYEYGSIEYFKKYDGRSTLGNTEPGDGYRFRGAGHVQNTGRRNAGKATKELNRQFNLGIDLVNNPEMRIDPKVSALSLFLGNHQGWWTGMRLPNYAGYGNWDMKGARTVVNGTDRWREIGEYAGKFLDALKEAQYQPIVIADPVLPEPLPDPVPEPPTFPPPALPDPIPASMVDILQQSRPEASEAQIAQADLYGLSVSLHNREMLRELIQELRPPDGNQPKQLTSAPNQGPFFMTERNTGMFANTLPAIKTKTGIVGLAMAASGAALMVLPVDNAIVGVIRQFWPLADSGTLITMGLAAIFGREAISKNGNGA